MKLVPVYVKKRYLEEESNLCKSWCQGMRRQRWRHALNEIQLDIEITAKGQSFCNNLSIEQRKFKYYYFNEFFQNVECIFTNLYSFFQLITN